MHYKFYYSRWSALSYLLLGFGLLLVGFAMFEIGINGKWLLAIFGPLLFICGLLMQLITLMRLIANPAVLDVGPEGILYRYGTFNFKKVMRLPWDQIRDVKFGDITYRSYGPDAPLPVKIEYVTITVADGFLKDYGAFKDNIFLAGNDLQIMTSTLRKFNGQYLLDGLATYGH